MPATVPGSVQTDLLANKAIGDPFYRLNEKDQQWIMRELGVPDRAPHRRATAAREHVELVFDGLDTYAESSSTASRRRGRQHVPDLARGFEEALRPANTLVVRFRSPIEQVKPATIAWLQAAGRERSGRRNGQHVDAQGALPLRVGLGPALRHQRHLAAGRDRGVGRRAPGRRAGVPGSPDAQGGQADGEGARPRVAGRQGPRTRRLPGRRRGVVGPTFTPARRCWRSRFTSTTPSCGGRTASGRSACTRSTSTWTPQTGNRAISAACASACAPSRWCTSATRKARASPSRSTAPRYS